MKGNPEKRKTHEKLYKYYKTPKNGVSVKCGVAVGVGVGLCIVTIYSDI